jgi:hypothetical protein
VDDFDSEDFESEDFEELEDLSPAPAEESEVPPEPWDPPEPADSEDFDSDDFVSEDFAPSFSGFEEGRLSVL